MKQTPAVLNDKALRLALIATKGLPGADVILFLNSMLDISRRPILEKLAGLLHYEGQGDLYAYYVKKLLDAGWARKSDFWYLMAVQARCREAAELVRQAADGADAEVAARAVFLAVAAAGGEAPALVREYGDLLGRYRGLAAHIAGTGAPESAPFDIAAENYGLVAFAAGRRTANKLLTAWPNHARECALLQAEWYTGSGLYGEYVMECHYRPQQDDLELRVLLADCLLMANRYDEALRQIMVLLRHKAPNDAVFNLCQAIAARAPSGETQSDAAVLAGRVRAEYAEMTDWRDVVNTGYIPGEEMKKQRRALAAMTVAQFDKSVELSDFDALPGQIETAAAAARIYLDRGRAGEALACLRRQLAHRAATAGTWRMLAELFLAAGNAAAAKAMGDRVMDT
jgi:thioredoxin-like negative regulator of GroEL